MKTNKKDFNNLPVITYARTNTINTQGSYCGSIDEQIEAMRYWARLNQSTILKEYIDECVSGINEKPPSLCEMLDAIKHGLIVPAYVVVCDFTRVSRNIKVSEYFRCVTKSKNVSTISLSNFYTNIPEQLDNESESIYRSLFKKLK
jgi:DNA invertase Pin-like site-specific DNA recombinase